LRPDKCPHYPHGPTSESTALRHLQAFLLAAGLIVAVAVIGVYGFADVSAGVLSAGWGIVWIVLYHTVPLAADAAGWGRLFDDRRRPGAGAIYLYRWISEAVNNLLPVAQVGGEVVRVRLAEKAGAPGTHTAATVIVDVTVGLFALMMFAALGIVLLLISSIDSRNEIYPIVAGVAVFTALITGFLVAQRAGMVRLIGRFAARIGQMTKSNNLSAIVGGVHRLDAGIQQIYRRRTRLAACFSFRMASFILGSGEVWLGLYFLNQSTDVVDALVIYSLTMAIRSAAFAIPGGLGAQEGAFLVVGTMLGLDPETALALAILKRVREILFGLPGLAAWWLIEHRLLAHASATKD
jgi:putative membrane protein